MLDKFFPLYVFVFISTLTLTALIERRFIPLLKKRAKQPIYEEGPGWHISKSGTPTMGGLAFLIASLISVSAASVFFILEKDTESFCSLLLALLYALGNALIGVIDDYTKLKKHKNAGLTPFQKLFFQFLLAVIFLTLRAVILKTDTALHFSFGKIELGIFYYPLSIFVLLGLVNSANLTDGIDGLASSVSFGIAISLFYLSAALNPAASIISSSLIGATIGFLLFNLHPAKIFMGDTGSLYLGALVASCGFILDNIFIMLLIASVYVIEGFSVVLQVFYYKLTHKRLFKMAPLHHHLEKCGFSENKICLCAIFLTFILSIPAYIFYLP